MNTTPNIRVLVAEDSPTARALLVGMISASSGLEVAGQATNGLEAVELTKRLRPDVVTMDIQMPVLDGFEATKRIMIEAPTPIVIVSSLDVRNVQFAMAALEAGALAVLPKPVGPTSPEFEQATRYLAVTLRSMSQVKLVRHWPTDAPYKSPSTLLDTDRATTVAPRVVAIVASTGGPIALQGLLAALPADFPVPILFVQHIALGFAPGFANWLAETSRVRVKVAVAGEPLRPGTAYLAPDDQHLGVSERSTVLLSSAPPVGSFRPSGTFLFESAARVFGPAALGVILTGMGSDGVEGLRAIKAAGGQVIAQDERTSAIYGMPGAAVAAGVVNLVLPLTAIAAHLGRMVQPRPPSV